MIATQAKEANDYALQQEQQANDPLLAKYKDWTIKTVTDHRKLAAYTLKLPTALQPWLVLAEGHFEGTGSFTVRLAGSILKVEHGSLGSSSNLHKMPVVIFVEKEINAVQLSSSVSR